MQGWKPLQLAGCCTAAVLPSPAAQHQHPPCTTMHDRGSNAGSHCLSAALRSTAHLSFERLRRRGERDRERRPLQAQAMGPSGKQVRLVDQRHAGGNAQQQQRLAAFDAVHISSRTQAHK